MLTFDCTTDWKVMPATDTVLRIICRVSNRLFVGLPLCTVLATQDDVIAESSSVRSGSGLSGHVYDIHVRRRENGPCYQLYTRISASVSTPSQLWTIGHSRESIVSLGDWCLRFQGISSGPRNTLGQLSDIAWKWKPSTVLIGQINL